MILLFSEVLMSLAPELKEILACPRCKGDLEFHEDHGEIHCPRCKLAYGIRDDIPIMLVDEARPLP
ncbi:MAG: hypothetical protein A2V77_13245 [Anaeromyxobacter sp. RBG_16_69_14]|nr:MAG: hypothetical protein A2V77_13245 [Anaeromyxobacter sp. RBG_16_69_14]